ncbi:MAG: DUF3604 domain-containing protein [Candidatus Azotimanducaceae bacterium]
MKNRYADRLRTALLIAILCLAQVPLTVAAQDYLDAQLRAAVDELQQDAAQPTTLVNHSQRSALLWRWANAFAVSGGYVPVNLTAAARTKLPDIPTPAVLRAIDDYIAEMTLLDKQPNALGKLSATLGPFVARSNATLQQMYVVGEKPISVGGGIAVPRHFMADYGVFQATRPDAANYVTVTSSNPNVHFVADRVPVAGMHGGFRGAAPVLFFRLSAGELTQDDVVTITYGARFQGGDGLLMPTFSSDRMPFPLYVDFDGNGPLYSLPIQPIRVIGGAVDGVHGFAPSVVRPGESFTLSVRAQDPYYNRASGRVPGWQVLHDGQVIAALSAGEQALQTIENLQFQDEGVVRLSIRSVDGAITGKVNPIMVSADAQRIFWGDTHGHSGFAEGIGTPERFMTWAKDDARLDFVTHSEHDIWLDDYEWQHLKDNVETYSEPGRFIAYLGYEWTTRNLYGGHHNVLFRTTQGRDRISTQFYPTLTELYEGLRKQYASEDVIVIPHAHQSGNYRLSDPQLQPLVEIMSQHGSFEWFGRKYLEHGHQVGFTAASDNHLSQPGYTAPKGRGLSQRGGLGAVLGEELTRDELFDNMRQRMTYATTGDRIILQTHVNDLEMGQRGRFKSARSIDGRVVGTGPIAEIAVIKNGRVVWAQDYSAVGSRTRMGSQEALYLTFSSDSEPMHTGDNPRGWRPWQGQLRVKGATLDAVAGTDFFNSDVQQLERDADNPNIIRFATATRGDTSSIILSLKDIKRSARVAVELEAGMEFGGGPPIYRRHQKMPESAIELEVNAAKSGQAEVTLPFGIYQDVVSLRRVAANGPEAVTFSWQDQGSVQGDYYYVRVTQVDGAMAWSSPVWIGGYAPR